MRKNWCNVSFNVTEEEKEELKKFAEDYAIKYNKDSYTLNKLLKQCTFFCMKNFYNGKLLNDFDVMDGVKDVYNILDEISKKLDNNCYR